MARIHPGMTLGQIRLAIPDGEFEAVGVREHGGVWYDVLISDTFYIQIRVAHPRVGVSVEQSLINYSPSLENRNTHQLISGKGKSW